jgi:FtsZ-interacting cell division protein ZipA
MCRSLPCGAFAIVALLLPFLWATGQESKDSKQDTKSESKYEETLQQLLDSLSQMTKTLAMVVDEESAKSNRSVLRVHAVSFQTARKQSQDLAPPAPDVKEKLAKKYRPEIEKSRKELVAQIARVQRVPGGNATLQEIRGVFEKKDP